MESAKIGLKCTKVGISAVASLLLLLFGDSDEYERKVEKTGHKVEIEVKKLEHQADKLERKADKLEDIEDEIRGRIKELDDLNWFLTPSLKII